MSDREPAGPPEPPAADPSAAPAPTCYRHPDRETYVRCTRCDRPICPDCMRPASVGFQCPECVKGSSQAARQGRTTFGGRVPNGRLTATVALVAVNVVVFLVMVALDPGRTLAGADTQVHRDFAMWPLGVAVDHEYYRLLTAMFLHYGPLHLLFNMYALVLFGPALESRLGALRFLALYLVAGLGASAVSYAFSPLPTLAAGASGAVFGLFAAYAVVALRLGYDVQGIAVYIGLSLLIGVVIPNIDVRAHVGGLVTGALAGAALALPPRGRWRALLQWAGLAVVLAAVVVLVVVRTQDLTGRF